MYPCCLTLILNLYNTIKEKQAWQYRYQQLSPNMVAHLMSRYLDLNRICVVDTSGL